MLFGLYRLPLKLLRLFVGVAGLPKLAEVKGLSPWLWADGSSHLYQVQNLNSFNVCSVGSNASESISPALQTGGIAEAVQVSFRLSGYIESFCT